MIDDINALADLFVEVRRLAVWFMEHQRSTVRYLDDKKNDTTYRPIITTAEEITVSGPGSQVSPLYFVNAMLTCLMAGHGWESCMRDSRGALYPSKGLCNVYLKHLSPDKKAGAADCKRRAALINHVRDMMKRTGRQRNDFLKALLAVTYPGGCANLGMPIIKKVDGVYKFKMRLGSPVLKCLVAQVTEEMTRRWKKPIYCENKREILQVLADLGAGEMSDETKRKFTGEIEVLTLAQSAEKRRQEIKQERQITVEDVYTAVAEGTVEEPRDTTLHVGKALGPVYAKFANELDEKIVYLNATELHKLRRMLEAAAEGEFTRANKEALASIAQDEMSRDQLVEMIRKAQEELRRRNEIIARKCRDYDAARASVGLPPMKWHEVPNP